jgi:hypothetical protein
MFYMDDSTLEKLKRRGHKIGMAAVTHDGKMIIAVDGRVLC